MTTVSFLSKLLASLMGNYIPKRTFGAPLHTLSKLYDVPIGFVSPFFEAVYCYIYGRRRVAVARYRMICLVLTKYSHFPESIKKCINTSVFNKNQPTSQTKELKFKKHVNA